MSTQDHDDEFMPPKTWYMQKFWWLYALIIGLLLFGVLQATAQAQTITAPTRSSAFDWQCQDASGAKLSDHTRFDTAFVACYNNPAGDHIQGGTYRLNKPSTPPPTPTCGAKPADETQTAQCAAPATGSWQQVRAYVSAAYPACWTAGPWTPAEAPAGACTTPTPEPVALVAPVLDAPTSAPNATDPTRFNIALTWSAVPEATSYEVRRCTGVNCSSMTLIKTDVVTAAYTNTNLPGGFSYSYKVRAMRGTEAGPMSNIVTIALPAQPQPPPQANGSATLQWQAPTTNTDGSPLTTLAGFRIVYGNAPTALTQTLQVANPALTTYVVDKLSAGTWYFALRAYTTSGAESADSNVASKVIQ
jgi:hypothetical protein